MEDIFFKISALTILAVFYGCYAFKMILQRRRGIATDQMGKGKAGAAKVIEMTMKAAACLCPAVELLSIFCLTVAAPIALRIAGIMICIAGDCVFIVSVITMKDNWRAGVSETDRTELVTEGIYRLSRNPAFLGFDLVYIGILWMYFNWFLFAASAFAAIMFHLQIVNVEEEFLLRTFGDEYLQYKNHVNRYLGRKYGIHQSKP